MTDAQKVRYHYDRYRKANGALSLIEFAKDQATRTLGTSMYGDPALYQRWLKRFEDNDE